MWFSIVPPSSLDGRENWDGNLVSGIQGSLFFLPGRPDWNASGAPCLSLTVKRRKHDWNFVLRMCYKYRRHLYVIRLAHISSAATQFSHCFRVTIGHGMVGCWALGRSKHLPCQNDGWGHGYLSVVLHPWKQFSSPHCLVFFPVLLFEVMPKQLTFTRAGLKSSFRISSKISKILFSPCPSRAPSKERIFELISF